jgi:hypothetical protein
MASIVEFGTETMNPLSVDIRLLDQETYMHNDTEGWLEYRLELKAGSKAIATTNGTIHDTDVRAIERACITLSNSIQEYEPMEPDFYIVLIKPNDDEATFSCYADSGISSEQNGAYSGSNIGISISCVPQEIISFGTKLREERILITDNKAWEL